MSIKECIFEIKQMLSIYLTLMLPIFVLIAIAYVDGAPQWPERTFDSDLVFAYFMLFVIVLPTIGGIFWLFISLLFSSSIFWFFLELFTWLLTTKKEREKYDKPFK